ncbi:hypothetical protein AWN90_08710 [Nocardia terpenica]|uniref:Uncharacterized protein n=1 Tax=Nocardia terpenica TaxID=455432 RepID=A0A161X8Z5_9NOCA|nr:hypothetical protein AWN90_08710 [Nocardia terpenica]
MFSPFQSMPWMLLPGLSDIYSTLGRGELFRPGVHRQRTTTVDTEVHPPKILLIRGRAELDVVDGIPEVPAPRAARSRN